MNGFEHIWITGDGVSRAIVVVLVLMSLASWWVMLHKCWQLLRLRRLGGAMQRGFWQPLGTAPLFEALGRDEANPYAELAQVARDADAHPLDGRAGSVPQLDASDWMSRCLRNALDDIGAVQQNGMPVLASVGATAPFVGLLGTVWGIYHALLAIGGSSQPSLDQVAGPVGEALIMTAVGLFVALPAVLGYNAIGRANRKAMRSITRFANDLHDHYATGARLGCATSARTASAATAMPGSAAPTRPQMAPAAPARGS